MARIGTDLLLAANLLRKGDLVGIPTETVYGLAGNALDPDALLKIFKVKNRPSFDPLILHIHSFDQLHDISDSIPQPAVELARAYWPGPLTLVLTKKNIVPDVASSGLDTVAVRMPRHSLTRDLLSRLDFPLAAPSANPFGYISPTSAEHVAQQLGDKIPYILDGGPSDVGLESTILGFEGDKPVIYRLGGINLELLEDALGKIRLSVNQSSNPSAPGMLKSHYAPRKPLFTGNIPELMKTYKNKKIAVLSFFKHYAGINNQIVLSENGDLDEAAHKLFEALRKLDQSDCEIIISELFPEKGLGRAINDRLKRASVK
ncbi:MAG TPA: L-threonylcarbamoyladenylate synthase [Cyclobacteriaceae bacterium]